MKPARRFSVSGATTSAERQEIRVALAMEGYAPHRQRRSYSAGVHDVMLAFARSEPVRQAVRAYLATTSDVT